MAILAIGVVSFLAGCGSTPGTQHPQVDDTSPRLVSTTGQQGLEPAISPTSSTQPTSANQAALTEFKPTPVPDGAYGDFSDQSWTTIDFIEATRRVVDCMQDHGFSVAIVPPGNGTDWRAIPADQQEVAHAQEEECRRSMAIPEFSWPTPEELRLIYEYNVKLNECLASLGFNTTPPPSFEVFQDAYATGPWMAYFGSDVGAADLETMRICPEVPPGGFGAWDIGDPIEPLPSP